MKVVLVEPIAIPGMWKYDLGLTTELAAIGVDVSIISSKAFPVKAINPKNIRIYREFPNFRNSNNSYLKAVQYLKGILKARSHIRDNKYEIIHWQMIYVYPPLDAWLGKILSRLSKHLIVTIHDIKPFSYVRYKGDSIIKNICKSAERIIVHDESNKREFDSIYSFKNKISVVPHGGFELFSLAQADKRAIRRKLGLPENGKIVLFFGQIKKEKGLNYLIRAIRKALYEVPNIYLVIAGRPCHVEMQKYIDEIKQENIMNRTKLDIDHIEEEKMNEYFLAADIVSLPYLTVSQSGVLLQAMTYGIPVVVSDVGALGPTVKTSSAGVVVSPGDVDQLSAAIIKILSDDRLSQQMAINARNAIKNEYSWRTCAKKTYEIYREVIKNKNYE